MFLERELTLDGAVVSAVFHDSMDMGVVGTTAGTLWYVSWAEGTSTRLISGHRSKVSAGPLLTQVGSLLAPSPLPVGAVSARRPRSSPRPHGLRDPACPTPFLVDYLEKAGRPCWDPQRGWVCPSRIPWVWRPGRGLGRASQSALTPWGELCLSSSARVWWRWQWPCWYRVPQSWC